jgi:putative membrane protein
MLRAVVGFVSGVVATGPMTAAMLALHRRLPAPERYPLPPGEILAKIADDTGADALRDDTRSAATLLAHYGYGGAAGAAYAILGRGMHASPVAKGAAFGLLVWLVSYMGLLPGAGILEPASRHPARRNALMIAAHLVWGTGLAVHHAMLAEDLERIRPDRGRDVKGHA